MKLSEMMRVQPILRGALIAPSLVVLVFVFFNLTATVDQNAVVQRLTVGIVNLDEGVTLAGAGPVHVADQAVAALERQLPLSTIKFPDEPSAMTALDRGVIVAALILPPDFSRTIASGATAQARVINTDHLSVLETQVGRTVAGQLQAALTVAVLSARTQFATRLGNAVAAPAAPATPGLVPAVPVPPVTVTPLEAPPAPVAPAPATPATATPATATPATTTPATTTNVPPLPAAAGPPLIVAMTALHAAANPVLLQVPFVMSFASWMGSLIGGILLFFGTRPLLRGGATGSVALVRTVIPVFATVLAALMGVLLVGWLGGAWEHFWELWAFRWLEMAASMMTITALFSLLGFFAFLVAVPLVFYQSMLAGLLAPPSAAPAWLTWLDRAPFYETTVALRTLLIGGPANVIPWNALSVVLGGAIVAIWIGTLVWSRRGRQRA